MDASIKEFVGVVSPVIALVAGAGGIVIKLHVKRLEDRIKAEKELRAQFEKNFLQSFEDMKKQFQQAIEATQRVFKEALDTSVETWKKELEDLREDFKDGLKYERDFRLEVIKRHDENIKELFDKKVSKEVCAAHHEKWDGVDRRKRSDS